jgi:hypothetical protein
LLIGREQGDEVPARGVADQEHLIRIAAIVLDVVLGPGEGAGEVLDVLGMFHGRREPIVGQHRADPLARKIFADGGIESAAAIVAEHPGAAVNEHDDGEIGLALGQKQIDAMAMGVRLRTVVVGDIAYMLDSAGVVGLVGAIPQPPIGDAARRDDGKQNREEP